MEGYYDGRVEKLSREELEGVVRRLEAGLDGILTFEQMEKVWEFEEFLERLVVARCREDEGNRLKAYAAQFPALAPAIVRVGELLSGRCAETGRAIGRA